jgi:coenzyme F420-reducing hydrogenase delta subunit
MGEPLSPDIPVYLCRNCIDGADHLPRQWEEDGARVLVREVPCSGKIDAQYLFHALEAGARGVCVVTCPKGECRLAQGNYRAEVRVQTVRRLLAEIGLEAERAELLTCAADDNVEALVREAARRLASLGATPLQPARK